MLQITHNYYGIKSYHSLGAVHSCEPLSMFPLSLCNRELTSVGDETGNQNKVSGFVAWQTWDSGQDSVLPEAGMKPLYLYTKPLVSTVILKAFGQQTAAL